MPNIREQNLIGSLVGSEVTIREYTENLHFAAHVSITPLQFGESVQIRLYIRVVDADGEKVKDMGQWDFADKTDNEIIYVPWEPPGTKWKLTLTQIGGSPHNYGFIIYDAP